MIRLFAPALLCSSLAFGVACDSGKKEASNKAADAKKSGDAKDDAKKASGTKAADTKAPNPHAPADPHAGLKGGPADPHAGAGGPPAAGAGPMAGAPPKPPGPPREITISGEVADSAITGLTFKVPKEWESSTPTSSMRLAQWVIPGPGGDAELVVFRFPGGGGSVQANIDRWKGQFQPPEGKTIDDLSTVKTIEGSDGLKTTLVDVTGTYVAAIVPGADDKHNEAAYRMFAAVIEGSGDAYYFKAVGPAKTLDLWVDPFGAMIETFKPAA